MTTDADFLDRLEELRALAVRKHYTCEDPFYSCPKSEEGCYDAHRGPECDCGADEHNEKVAKTWEAIMDAVKRGVAC